MDWDKLYNEYLDRCNKNPLNFSEFVKLRKSLIHNKKMEEKKKQWFDIK